MDDRIVVVNKENEGLIYARKSGLDIARGEYVYHLDGDDYLEHDAMEKLYNKAIEKESDYVMADYYIIWKDFKEKKTILKEGNGLSGQDLLFFLLSGLNWNIWGKLIRKDLFEEIIYKDVFMGEDIYFNMQIALKVKNAAVVDCCLHNYVMRKESVTNRKDDNKLKLEIVMIDSVCFLFGIYSYDQRIKDFLYGYFSGLVFNLIRSNRRKGLRNALKYCFLNKIDVKTFLREKRKPLYIVFTGYLYAPWLISIVTRLWYILKFLFRKFRN